MLEGAQDQCGRQLHDDSTTSGAGGQAPTLNYKVLCRHEIHNDYDPNGGRKGKKRAVN
jgi:hypothetical protein